MITPRDRAAWLIASLIAAVFGWVELDEISIALALAAPLAHA
jgi:hypothetical protein